MKSRIGLISLVIAASGTIIIQIGIYIGLFGGWGWHILSAGFTAGTVGGLADWFAVSALFHKIPAPYIGRHTNIIVKNRKQITDSIVDLVTNKWLSPAVITERIAKADIAAGLLKLLKNQGGVENESDVLKAIVEKTLDLFDSTDLIDLLTGTLKEQFINLNLAKPIGNWIQKALVRGDHHRFWLSLIDIGQSAIAHPQTKELLLMLIKQRAEDYKNESFTKKIFISLAEGLGAVDTNSIVDKLISTTSEFLQHARNDPQHGARRKFDESIGNFARRLAEGQKDEVEMVNQLKQKLVENTQINKIVISLLRQLKLDIQQDLRQKESSLFKLLGPYQKRLIAGIESDEPLLRKIDSLLKSIISGFASANYKEIGAVIQQSLSNLTDEELVAQIRDKVGNDLQYIRLNGAIVGGFAGMVIYTLQSLLNHNIN